MSSSFSDKPYPPPRHPEPPPTAYPDEPPPTAYPDDPPPRFRREPGTRFNFRRFLAGMSVLFILLGALLICFVHGGLLNQKWGFNGGRYVDFNHPGGVFGFLSLAVGAIGFVVLFSFEKRRE
jgi:hypothetical protein